ncbi:MAG TPA: hypothetical protein VIN57_00205 [Magnetovibrio sp.]
MTISTKSTLKPSVKPIARLDASLLLARKGEASPAVAATQHNNPGLAWGAPAHPGDFQPHAQAHNLAHTQAQAQAHSQAAAPSRPAYPTAHFPTAQATPPHVSTQARLRPDSFFATNMSNRNPSERDPVALTMRVEDETYLRLKYLAQRSGRSTQQVLAEALDVHLSHSGVPRSRKLVIKSE